MIMHRAELDDLLVKTSWVKNPRMINNNVVEVGLTPTGHDFIRDQGKEAFEEGLHASASGVGLSQLQWKIRTTGNLLASGDFSAGRRGAPLVLSEIEEPGAHRLLLEVPRELSWFLGHFPENPVLPGVTQLHWAILSASAIFSTRRNPGNIRRLKFKSLVVPPRVIELTLRQQKPNQVHFRFSSQRQDHSEGLLDFGG
jgi:hypothetical protein